MGHSFAGVNDLDGVFAVRAHLYENVLAQIAFRRGRLPKIDKLAQHTGKPMRLDGDGIVDARSGGVDRNQVAGDAKIGRLNLLSFNGEEIVDICSLRAKRGSQRGDQECRQE
ncbi:MAG: hypothetical protein WDM87_14015 [Terracidiphilus sp.]